MFLALITGNWLVPSPSVYFPKLRLPRHLQTDDTAWVIVFATKPTTINTYTTPDARQTYQVKAGVSKLSFPLKADAGIKTAMSRDGETVTVCTPIGYRFESRPGVYNFNAFVAMSP